MSKWTVRVLIVALLISVGWSSPHAQQQPNPTPALTAQDYYEIQQLYARYAHALDSEAGHGAMFAAAFTPDGILVDRNGNRYAGRDQLLAFARQNPDPEKGPINTGHF